MRSQSLTDTWPQVSGINIGPVHRKDVMRAASMLEKAKELAVILCFDVPVDKEAEKVAEELGIKIFKGAPRRSLSRSWATAHLESFKADIIYHLFDAFTAYNAAIVESKKADSAPRAVFPCRLKIIQCFAKRDRAPLSDHSVCRGGADVTPL